MPRKPLRLWPAVVIAIVQLLVMFGAPVVAPDAGPIGMLGGVARRVADRRVVAVLQPRALVRARRRDRPDDRRGVRDQGRRPRIDGRGWPGDDDLLPADAVPRPGSRRVGGGHTSSPGRSSACVVGRGDPARVRAVCPHPNGRYQRRGRSGSSTGGGRRLPSNCCWPRPATSPSRSRRRRRQRRLRRPAEIPKETPTGHKPA